ncbi:MAG TPA: tetratricopeptide repeat protein [Candidatus Acidoferrales bacterium]|nr:tetratricopeptide repeat protein [Candidatus Acidoferrales bacterium]
MRSTTVVVSVRGVNGTPLDVPAFVKLFSNSMTFNMTSPTRDGASASFPNVPPGDYNVEVTAPGYKTAAERVSVFGGGGSTPVFVYISTDAEAAAGSKAPSGTVMSPKLLMEIDKGLQAMRRQLFEEALEHFTKAEKLAPANPDVLYFSGAAQGALRHPDLARSQYEKALAISPMHQKSLIALGELQIQSGEFDGALQTLQKAFRVNGGDWRTHFLLAAGYFGKKDYEPAQTHAKRAIELAKTQPEAAQVLLGRILEARGDTPGAKKAYAAVASGSSKGLPSLEAKQRLEQLERAEASAKAAAARPAAPAAAVMLADLPLLPQPAVDRAWAPPDIDAVEYHFAPGVACPANEVLTRAQKHMSRQIGNFEKFAATEHIVHQEVNGQGVPGDPRAKDFWYLVFVHHAANAAVYLDETRDGGQNLQSFPTSLATTGLVGLGVAILDPMQAKSFTFSCEGLSSRRGQAAWEVRFEQRKDMPPQVRVWQRDGHIYPIPLKGRMWISASSYDLMRLETDVREPVEKLQLLRDHLAIDYGPVSAENSKVTLWLPWTAEMFMEVHGHRYHHQHTLTNYVFFSVDTKNKVSDTETETPEPGTPQTN